MIIGIGTDVIEIERISGLMTDKFIKRILHPDEIKVLETYSHEARRASFVAGRFAVKEAYAKAYGTGIGQQFRFNDICCLNNEAGKPYIKDAEYKVHVSIAHSHTVATAFVIIEEK